MAIPKEEVVVSRRPRGAGTGASPSFAAGPALGSTLGPWVLRDPLALGAVGVVFDGLRRFEGSITEPVAIHVPLAKLQESEQFREAYAHKTRISLDVRHPGLVRTLDGGEGAMVWRVMERAVGWNLQVVIQRARARGVAVPPMLVLAIGELVADALTAVHAHGLAHGRLTPSRVLSLPDGSVKICGWSTPSFGRSPATLQESPAELSELAPEQVLGLATTPATDVWHLAALLLSLYGRGNPYRGTSSERVQRAILAGPPPTLPEEVPESIAEVLRAALSRAPSERPQLHELRDALAESTEGPVTQDAWQAWLGQILQGVSLLSAVTQQAAASGEAEAIRVMIGRVQALDAAPWRLISTSVPPRVVAVAATSDSVMVARGVSPEPPTMEPLPPTPPGGGAPVSGAPVAAAPVVNAGGAPAAGGPAPTSRRRQGLFVGVAALALVGLVGAGIFGAAMRPEAPPESMIKVEDPGAIPAAAPAISPAVSEATPPPASTTSASEEPRADARATPSGSSPKPSAPAAQTPPPTAPGRADPPETRPPARPAPAAAEPRPSAVAKVVAPSPAVAPPVPTAASASSSVAASAPPPSSVTTTAPPSASAPEHRLVDLRVSVTAGRVVVQGDLDSAGARPLGMLVEDDGGCEYRVKLADTASDAGISRLPVASPLVQQVTVSESGGAVWVRARCGTSGFKPSLQSGASGFTLTLTPP